MLRPTIPPSQQFLPCNRYKAIDLVYIGIRLLLWNHRWVSVCCAAPARKAQTLAGLLMFNGVSFNICVVSVQFILTANLYIHKAKSTSLLFCFACSCCTLSQNETSKTTTVFQSGGEDVVCEGLKAYIN